MSNSDFKTELQKIASIVCGREKFPAQVALECENNRAAQEYINLLASQIAYCIDNLTSTEFVNAADERYDNNIKFVSARFVLANLLLLAGYRSKFEDLNKYMKEFKLSGTMRSNNVKKKKNK